VPKADIAPTEPVRQTSFSRSHDQWNKGVVAALAYMTPHRFESEPFLAAPAKENGDLTMKNVTLTLLAAAAIGAISIGSVSAMPVNNLAGLGESHLQDVRLVCDRFGRCYNTRRAYRSQRYYARPGYYGQPGYYGHTGYGYYGGPRVGVGIGPLGFGMY
jgi:hypothetical protein